MKAIKFKATHLSRKSVHDLFTFWQTKGCQFCAANYEEKTFEGAFYPADINKPFEIVSNDSPVNRVDAIEIYTISL